MDSRHTEGEWYLSPTGSMVLARGADGIDRIVCHLSLTRGGDEAIANGELIATAPMLLAALDALAGLPQHLIECGLCKCGFHKICKVAVQAAATCEEVLKRVRRGQEVRA